MDDSDLEYQPPTEVAFGADASRGQAAGADGADAEPQAEADAEGAPAAAPVAAPTAAPALAAGPEAAPDTGAERGVPAAAVGGSKVDAAGVGKLVFIKVWELRLELHFDDDCSRAMPASSWRELPAALASAPAAPPWAHPTVRPANLLSSLHASQSLPQVVTGHAFACGLLRNGSAACFGEPSCAARVTSTLVAAAGIRLQPHSSPGIQCGLCAHPV